MDAAITLSVLVCGAAMAFPARALTRRHLN
jgi:hypothetical protein